MVQSIDTSRSSYFPVSDFWSDPFCCPQGSANVFERPFIPHLSLVSEVFGLEVVSRTKIKSLVGNQGWRRPLRVWRTIAFSVNRRNGRESTKPAGAAAILPSALLFSRSHGWQDYSSLHRAGKTTGKDIWRVLGFAALKRKTDHCLICRASYPVGKCSLAYVQL